MCYVSLIKIELFMAFANLRYTILNPGSASSATEDMKRRKYSQLVADFELVPVAVETSVQPDAPS